MGTPGRPTHTGLDQRGGASREDTGSCSGMALLQGTQKEAEVLPSSHAMQGRVSRISELHPH